MRADRLKSRRMFFAVAMAVGALVLLAEPGVAQGRIKRTAAVTLQVVALEESRLSEGALQLGAGDQAELELRATDASGGAVDLSATQVSWQASNPDVLHIKPMGSRAVVGRRGDGEATLTVAAMGQTVALRAPATAPAVVATPVATASPSGSAGTIATLAPFPRRNTETVATRDLCASGKPDASWGQPCIRSVRPATAGPNMTVFITGTGFTGTRATVGGSVANVQTDSLIILVVPPGLQDGSIDVTNPSSGRRSTASVRIVGPQITLISPMEGRAGDRVIISGYGFSNPRPGVIFANGQNVAASEVVDGPGTLINAILPNGDVTGRIHIGSLVSSEDFVELVSFDPSPSDVVIPPTGTVTVTGKAMQNIMEVVVASALVPIISKTYTRLTFGLPPAYQQATSSTAFGRASFAYRVAGGGTRVMAAGPNITLRVPPEIVSLDPDSGYACNAGTARGRGLISTLPGGSSQPTVLIGNVQLPIIHATETAVGFALTKDARTGPITVRGNGQQAVSPMPFRIVAPAPTAQLQGGQGSRPVGATVQFVGRLEEVTQVAFTGGVALTQGWTVSPIGNSRGCEDLFQIAIPPGATTGPVTFTNPAGSTTSYLTIVP